jgi:ethanolamine utilization cobalamin adenosyltransferase
MNETCLDRNMRVGKNHPRITFRGSLDSLEADILEAQIIAAEKGESYYIKALEEILDFVRGIMSAEVNDLPYECSEKKLFGFNLDEIHKQTHKVKDFFGFPHPVPEYTMGALPVRLNTLRTRIRETELIAVKTIPERDDIIYSLNRLSSAVYWLFCKCIPNQP